MEGGDVTYRPPPSYRLPTVVDWGTLLREAFRVGSDDTVAFWTTTYCSLAPQRRWSSSRHPGPCAMQFAFLPDKGEKEGDVLNLDYPRFQIT
ncbi:hypothetical protein M407DRAFT_87494 [Tulasnella calospora MUT 4182]|uniref:Uncharacterized protein n=1 Tax=Tulasnella calospora MUT 4182 TaxID=1051891 RepID=A0A0C3QWY5_9AGAM|nr:hypothetical protein M407DRAFT_87494 [Tulasnella calospora MUT 4182]